VKTRRAFLKDSAIAMFGVGVAPTWLARAADTSSGKRKVLVAIVQRGAADGLNIVVPHGDPHYYALRPTIAIPKTEVADLNGFYGLHPSLAPLKSIFDSGHLAIVEAVGSPDPTRSHFDAQDYMESGTPGLKATPDGWLNRAIAGSKTKSPVKAVAIGATLPRTLRGPNAAVAVRNLSEFQVNDAGSAPTFESMYASAVDRVLSGTGQDTFNAVRTMQSIGRQRYSPSAGVQYPNGRLAQSLQQIARMIKADVGLEVAFADMGGWDTHVNESGARPTVGPLANLLSNFGQAIAAFYQDLGDRVEDVVIVTMSEFGRTARENGNRGTDHGHANVMFVLGGPVAGGKIYGDWPGLAREQLYEGRDLALTTDFRDVLGEVVSKHLGANPAAVFPNHKNLRSRQLLKV
jgi:uncharacterized protein (DUF1501 family)